MLTHCSIKQSLSLVKLEDKRWGGREERVKNPFESRLGVLCKIPTGLLCSWALKCWEMEGTRQYKPPSPDPCPMSQQPCIPLWYLRPTAVWKSLTTISAVRVGWPHTRSVINSVLWNPEELHTQVSESAWKVFRNPQCKQQNASRSHLQMRKYVLVLMLLSDNVTDLGLFNQ